MLDHRVTSIWKRVREQPSEPSFLISPVTIPNPIACMSEMRDDEQVDPDHEIELCEDVSRQ